MTDPSYTDITMILDRSGSMQSIKTDIEGGFDAFIAEQRDQPGRCTVSLVQFDDRYEEVFSLRPVEQVPPLVLRPRGSTALLDAIGRAVAELGGRLSALPEDQRPATVVVGIMTDGLENASREFTHPMIKALITEQEQTWNWTFLYLGANQDAVEVGAAMGIAPERAMTYETGAAQDAMRSYGASVRRVRGAARAGAAPAVARAMAAFTDEERRGAADGR